MARARNIKPGFFKNEQLAECDPLARILFAGLWCEADREGRLEDRPKRLKAEYLPYDDCDADALLDQLAERGFIIRYESEGRPCIQIDTFWRHQNPHVREPVSTIQAPDGYSAGPVQAPDKHRAGPADSISPSLIPDSSKEAELALALPLNSGDEFPITKAQVREFSDLYPAVDVTQQLRSMRGWLVSNPAKRKTRSGVLRFVNRWLSKAQDDAPAVASRSNGTTGPSHGRREL